jgi:outer membrane protein assembly factor BamB
MRVVHCIGCLVATLILPSVARSADAEGWPTFRGPQRTGVAADTGLLKTWPNGGPRLLWEAEGAGRGYASLAIADGKIYTLGDGLSTASDDDEHLVCFDQSSGEQLWATKTGSAWNKGQPHWQGSRSTPTIDDDRVYVLTAEGELISFKTSGEELWRKHLKQDFSGKKADGWGYSESVLIDGDRLVCTPGGGKNTMIALDKRSGDTLWTSSSPDDRGAGHASIVIAEIGDTRIYVQTTGSGAMGVRASDGELLWTYAIQKTTAVIPTPIVRGDLVFFSAGYGTGGALLRQVATNDGRIEAEEIYPTIPALGNKHGGIVLVGDYLYGDTDSRGTPFCADLMTGEIQWKSRGSGKKSASVAAADGHLYIRYSDGTMTLAKASSADFEEVGSFKIPFSGERPSWSHPVVADGKLYLREGDKVLCYDLRG